MWHLSPEGFRELRHSCFLSPKACAEFLGVSLRTVRHWDRGRNRVPWSVVRVLRLRRLGDLGALDDAWAGWTLNRNGLFSPDGRKFEVSAMRHWWSQIDRARLWQEAYDRGEIRGCGGKAPALTLQPEVWQAEALPEVALSLPNGAASPENLLLAFSGLQKVAETLLLCGFDASQLQRLPALRGVNLASECNHFGEFRAALPSVNGPSSNTGLKG